MSNTATIANETNTIAEGYFDKAFGGTVSLAEVARRGGKVTRVRILTEGRVADISYVHATIAGVRYDVQLDVGNLIPRNRIKGELIAWAQRQGVFAKGLGLLDENNWSSLF